MVYDGEKDRVIGSGHDGMQSYMWVFALLVLFAFVWRKDEHRGGGYEGIAPALALGAINQGGKPDATWDVTFNNAQVLGGIREEIARTGWTLDRDITSQINSLRHETTQQNFGLQKDVLEAKYTGEVQGLQNTQSVLGRIEQLEKNILNNKLEDYREKVAAMHAELVHSRRGYAPVQQANIYQQEVGAGLPGGYAYGY